MEMEKPTGALEQAAAVNIETRPFIHMSPSQTAVSSSAEVSFGKALIPDQLTSDLLLPLSQEVLYTIKFVLTNTASSHKHLQLQGC